MEQAKIILDNGLEKNVNGILYVFNSKYYFIYTEGEITENDYVKLYIVQVCKEVKNTPTGPIDTGYMLGMEISNQEEWKTVQESVMKIVNDKKNQTQSQEIQYLPINMLVNLKITSSNKFKLMKQVVEENFKVKLSLNENTNVLPVTTPVSENTNNESQNINSNPLPDSNNISSDVIIDYRARFFEEQEKKEELQEQIKILNEKLENIKTLIG